MSFVSPGNFFRRKEKRDIAAIIEHDPEGSGLYRSRIYTREYEQDGKEAEHRWIAKEYLSLRQQVALVHEHTKAIASEAFAAKMQGGWTSQQHQSKLLDCDGCIQSWLVKPSSKDGISVLLQM
jgi:hypothetical protein